MLIYMRDTYAGGLGERDPDKPLPGAKDLVDHNLYRAYQKILDAQRRLRDELDELKAQGNLSLSAVMEDKQHELDQLPSRMVFCYGDLEHDPAVKEYFDALELYDYDMPFLMIVDHRTMIQQTHKVYKAE